MSAAMTAPPFVLACLLLAMPTAAISQDAPRPRAREAGIAIAFSTAASLRIRTGAGPLTGGKVLTNEAMTPLFVAVAEATEAAILDSLCAARTATGNGVTVPELPVEAVKQRLAR